MKLYAFLMMVVCVDMIAYNFLSITNSFNLNLLISFICGIAIIIKLSLFFNNIFTKKHVKQS